MTVAQASSPGAPGWFAFFIVLAGVLVAVGVILIRRWDWKNHRKARMRLQGLLVLGAILVVLGLIVSAPIDSDARNALLAFYGVLIAAVLGLTAPTHVGNFLAGLVLTSRGTPETGDFIRSRDLLGGVTQQKLLHTVVETEDGDLTLVPNLQLVTEPLTVLSRQRGTIVSTEVSLGYDVAHGAVTPVLKAAGETAGLQDPFVLISDLGDFSVTYRVAGLLSLKSASDAAKGTGATPGAERLKAEAKILPLISTRSALRRAVLDGLHDARIEIVSPTFMNQRQLQPEQRFIPRTVTRPATGDDEGSADATTFRETDRMVSVEELETVLKEMVEKRQSLESQIKSGGSDGEVQRWSDKLAALQQEIEKQEHAVAAAKQEIEDG